MFFIWSLFFNPPHVNVPIVEDDTCGGTWFANTNVKTTYNQITVFPVEDIFLLKVYINKFWTEQISEASSRFCFLTINFR